MGYDIFKNRELGRGNFSIVYSAKNSSTGDECACKVSKIDSEESKAVAMNEVKIMMDLSKKDHILPVYNYYYDEKEMIMYIFMPIMDENLEEMLLQRKEKGESNKKEEYTSIGRLGEREALYYFYQIMRGVEGMHGMDVMHRDLKPENIFLDGDKIFIADFNLSKRTSMLTNSVVGTPKYMCPAVIDNKKGFGHFVDLWSAGLILYRMLYGIHLYDYLKSYTKPNNAVEYVRNQAKLLKAQEVLFPRLYVSEETKDIIKLLLNIDMVSTASAREVLKSSVFKRFIEQERKEKQLSSNLSSSFNISTGGMACNASILTSNIFVSNILHKSNLTGTADELIIKLSRSYEKILIGQKARLLYISHMCETAFDYFEYYDEMRKNSAVEYKEKFKEHHRDHLYFSLLLKIFYWMNTEEVLNGFEQMDRFDEYRKMSGLISSSIKIEEWTSIMQETIKFRSIYKGEFESVVKELKKEIQENIEFTNKTYEGVLSEERMKRIIKVMSKDCSTEYRRTFKSYFYSSLDRMFKSLMDCMDNVNVSRDSVSIAKKLIIISHYYQKYINEVKVDWKKLYITATNAETEKQQEIMKNLKSNNLSNKKRSSASNEDYTKLVGIFLVVVLVLLFILSRFL